MKVRFLDQGRGVSLRSLSRKAHFPEKEMVAQKGPSVDKRRELIQLSLSFKDHTEHLMARWSIFCEERTHPSDVRSTTIVFTKALSFCEVWVVSPEGCRRASHRACVCRVLGDGAWVTLGYQGSVHSICAAKQEPPPRGTAPAWD